MRNYIWVPLLALFLAPLIGAKPPQQKKGTAEPPPPWAYGFLVPAGAPGDTPGPSAASLLTPDDGTLRHLPGSTLAFTLTQIRDPFGPADWYPGDHPPMPEVVALGRKPGRGRLRPLPLSKWQRALRKRGARGSSRRLFHTDHE